MQMISDIKPAEKGTAVVTLTFTDEDGNAVVNAIALTSGNFGSPVNNSSAGAGRKIQCLVSSASDMKNISVNSAGSATKVALKNSAGTITLVEASISSSPVSLGASDQVNLSTFSVILRDPT